MAKIKYMGAADRREFKAGEDFQGRLATPLPHDVVLTWSNRHTIDSDSKEHQDIPSAFFELLAVEPGFKDVTGESIVPLNDAERLWRGQRDPHDTRYAKPEGDGPVFNEKFPTRLSPPPDQILRPATVMPNDDLEVDRFPSDDAEDADDLNTPEDDNLGEHEQ